MGNFRGIDVSHWQGHIDWAKVKAAGIQFAIIKAGGSDLGCYTDRRWEENYQGARESGIAVGAYYFCGPACTTEEAGQADAKRFLALLKGKKFEYPVFMDVEAQAPYMREGTTRAAIAFCEALKKAGFYVGIYASTYSGFQDRLDDSKLTAYDHWVAQYASKCTYAGTYGIWQHSYAGEVPGISGNVDLDVSYKDYPSIIKAGGFNGYAKEGAATLPASASAGSTKKSVDEIAKEVLAGKWGNGAVRKRRITAAGYDYTAVQKRVNELDHRKRKAQAVYYTVRSGDTLSEIASRYSTSVSAIQKLNATLIKNVNQIQVGWKIRVR